MFFVCILRYQSDSFGYFRSGDGGKGDWKLSNVCLSGRCGAVRFRHRLLMFELVTTLTIYYFY